MESRKSSINAVPTSDKRISFKSHNHPPLAVHQSRRSFASESIASTDVSPDPVPRRCQGRTETVGVITSVTSKYYLVRAKTNWVPILKGNLLNPDNSPIDPKTDFATLKCKKVRIVDPTSYTTIAILGDGECPETGRTTTNCETERIGSPDLSSIRENHNPANSLLQQYENLSIQLMTDVVALSRIIEGSGREDSASTFLWHEKSKIEKRVMRVVSELEQMDTPAALEMKKIFLDLMHNLNDRVGATCENCQVAKYDVRLSCGHKYCAACQHKLVQKILSGGSLTKCFLCKAALTKIDKRVVALDLYFHRAKTNHNSPHGADTARRTKPQHSHMRTASQGTTIPCSVSVCCSCCSCRSHCDRHARLQNY